MSHLEDQKKLTDNKGWGKVLVEHAKEKIEEATTKAKNVWGGMKVVAKKIKGD